MIDPPADDAANPPPVSGITRSGVKIARVIRLAARELRARATKFLDVESLWMRFVLPPRTARARRRLERLRGGGELPRIALVKQDCNEDLYCCGPDATAFETITSTLLRSGPASLFTLFDTRFFIVRTEPDAECNIWKEKSDPLQWAPQAWFEAFREHVPGRDHGQSQFARSVDDIPWQEFDLVISIDVSVPARVTARFPQVVWAYYVRELKAPSWRASFAAPLPGQDLYLSQLFAPRKERHAPHVVDFPYHFHHCGVFHQLSGRGSTLNADDTRRRGVFVEYHTARTASRAELQALAEFGPVYACLATDDQFDAKSGERIPARSMSPEGLHALMTSKYHVKWGGRAIFGTAKIEAIAAGCVVLSDLARDGTPFLHSKATAITDFGSLLDALRKLELDTALYERERTRQRMLVDYLCYLRPANELLDAWQRVRRQKESVMRNIS